MTKYVIETGLEKRYWEKIKRIRKYLLLLTVSFIPFMILEVYAFAAVFGAQYAPHQFILVFVLYNVVILYHHFRATRIKCPRCGGVGINYFLSADKKMRCANCYYSYQQFLNDQRQS
ncbi:MAG: hypothetical protein JXR76_10155 [Deltaproteobacteria bacterium]|nr:hypothetical protein [Deltaproteobacteria bacterium]